VTTSTRSPRLAILAAGLALVTAGTALAAAAAPTATATVRIENFTFDPPTLIVRAGTKVTWINQDDIPHTATSATRAFGSTALDTGEQFTFRFDEPGSYAYFCKLHPHMQGMIEVLPSG
jgi:plastocyanin